VAVSGDEEEARSLKQSLDDSAAADESDSDQEACSDVDVMDMRNVLGLTADAFCHVICILKFSIAKLRNR
jgi:hypothetical protein